MDEEGLKKTPNKLIFIGSQLTIEPDSFILALRRLKYAAMDNNAELTVQLLREIVPTFVTPEEFNQKILSKV
jgi:hypothetical protein